MPQFTQSPCSLFGARWYLRLGAYSLGGRSHILLANAYTPEDGSILKMLEVMQNFVHPRYLPETLERSSSERLV